SYLGCLKFSRHYLFSMFRNNEHITKHNVQDILNKKIKPIKQ
ncbi:14141_t:CDS:1, partial [Gigaspora margarita]